MKVVVTGAAGFIGSHACQELVDRGHDVLGFDSFDGYLYPASIKRRTAQAVLDKLPSKQFTMHEADVTDPLPVQAAITSDVDVVCHLAALAGVRPSLAEPARYARTNVEGTTTILEACRAAGVKRVVFASSSSVYGARGAGRELTDVEAFREDDPCLTPASPYAASKRAGELVCSTFRDLYGIGISSLRFFTVFGPRQRPDMAIHKFTRSIVAGQPITMFGDGSTRRDYTYVADIVAGTVAAIERIVPNAYNIYNLGGTTTTSLTSLIAIIEQTLDKKATIQRAAHQPGDVPITYADITNAKRDLDYQPVTSLEDGVAAFWDWFRRFELGSSTD